MSKLRHIQLATSSHCFRKSGDEVFHDMMVHMMVRLALVTKLST